MQIISILSVILLIAGLLMAYFASSTPMTILAIGLILVGAVMAKVSKRK